MPNPTAVSSLGLSLVRRFEGEEVREEALSEAAARVAPLLFVTVSQAQFDALVSLERSIGPEAFAASEVLAALNAGEPIVAADAFEVWRLDPATGRTLAALARRRAAEKALFLSEEAPAPQPSAAPKADPAMVSRVRAILAADPATAHALKPPPPRSPEDAADDAPPPPPPRNAAIIAPAKRERAFEEVAGDEDEFGMTPGERTATAALSALGLGLIGFAALGLPGAPASAIGPLAFAAAPGVVALAAAAYAALYQSRA